MKKRILVVLSLSALSLFLAGCNFISAQEVNDIPDRVAPVKHIKIDRNQTILNTINISASQAYQNSINYTLGFGVSPDINKALTWMRYSADGGYPEAQFKLGLIYFQGLGVTVDQQEGFYWINLAAHNKYPEAEYYLGYMYKNGIGTPKNNFLANYWTELGKKHGACGAHIDDDLNLCL